MSEMVYASLVFCSINFNFSHNSLGSGDKNIVFEEDLFLWDDEIPEAKIIKPGVLSNLIWNLSLVLGRPIAFTSK